MRITHILTIAVCATALFAACQKSAEPAYTIRLDLPAATQAEAMAKELPPVSSADAFVSWVASTDSIDADYATDLWLELYRQYQTRELADSFIVATDNASNALPPQDQARIYTALFPPIVVARFFRESTDAKDIIPYVKEIYATDSLSLDAFTTELEK